jgi:hypothetical protein
MKEADIMRPRRLPLKTVKLPFPFALAVAGLTFAALTGLAFAVGELGRKVAGEEILIAWDSELGLFGYPPPEGILGMTVVFDTLLFSLAVWLVVMTLSKSLHPSWYDAWIGAQVGSWTAVLGSAWWLILLFDFPVGDTSIWYAGFFIACGPGVAIPLAQYVGVSNSWLRTGAEMPPEWKQFGVRQLVAAITWFAVGLAVLKWLELVNYPIVLYLLGAIAYQLLSMRLVLMLLQWRYRRAGSGEGSRTTT